MNESIKTLKERLAKLLGIAVDNQRLLLKGRVLQDDELVSSFYSDNCMLNLVEKNLKKVDSIPHIKNSQFATKLRILLMDHFEKHKIDEIIEDFDRKYRKHFKESQ